MSDDTPPPAGGRKFFMSEEVHMPDLPLRTAVVIAVGIFLLTAAIGIAVVLREPSTGQQLIQTVRDQVMGTVDTSEPLPLALFIFTNNLQACVLLFLGGATLGTLTLFIIASNGIVIGGIMEIVREERGLLFVAAAVLPHGIFEIPSFILSASLGFIVGNALLAEWRGGGDVAAVASVHGRTFLLVVVPLLAIAAFIEAFITPGVIHLVT